MLSQGSNIPAKGNCEMRGIGDGGRQEGIALQKKDPLRQVATPCGQDRSVQGAAKVPSGRQSLVCVSYRFFPIAWTKQIFKEHGTSRMAVRARPRAHLRADFISGVGKARPLTEINPRRIAPRSL